MNNKSVIKPKSIITLEKGSLNDTFLSKAYFGFIRPWLKPIINKALFIFLAVIFLLMCFLFIFLMYIFSANIDKNYQWLSHAYSSSLYIMAVSPFLLGTASAVERNATPTVALRYKNRTYQLFSVLAQQYVVGLLLLTDWFLVAGIFTKIVLGSVISSHFSELVPTFLYFYLHYAAMINIAAVMSRTNIKLIKAGSYVILYLLSVLGTTFLPNVNFFRTHNNVAFTSWLTGIIIPCAVIVIFTFILKKFSTKADIL